MKGRRALIFAVVAAAFTLAGFLISYLLTNMFERKQEAKNPYVRLVEVNEETTDSAAWGVNWPRQRAGYLRTIDVTRTRFGGSEALPEQKIERRGHAYMLSDQEATRRVTERPQPGSCLHCHSAVIPTYRRLGGGDIFKGFEALGKLSYADARAEVVTTGSSNPVVKSNAPAFDHVDGAHPIGCVDCHSPATMELRVTRPGFIQGIQALASGQEPVPHIPSMERWRQGSRAKPYDPNADSTRQEMRSFVCGQFHVEYYCGPKATLFYPWGKGLKVEQIEAFYDAYKFDDGHRFYDWRHAETGAEALKAQHPEFELWSQGIHARSGVSCADCHMPYTREGALKVSDHWVRSPLLNISRSCQVCHVYPEDEIRARVDAIQNRTNALMQRTAKAFTDMLDAVSAAKKAGADARTLAPLLELQRKAQWRLDFVAAENSMGFHAPAEAARILAESIDFARQAEVEAYRGKRGQTPNNSR
jgi:nitrite reductase (cytochrome c-552)